MRCAMALSGLEIGAVIAVLAAAVWLGLAGLVFNLVSLLISGLARLLGRTREVDVVKGADGHHHARRVERQ